MFIALTTIPDFFSVITVVAVSFIVATFINISFVNIDYF
jgi:hypothetical protein